MDMTTARKKRKRLTVLRETRKLEELIGGELPGEDEVFRLVSQVEFSAAAFLRFVADRAHVRWLGAVSFRIGSGVLRFLEDQAAAGRIEQIDFFLGNLTANAPKNYRKLAERLRRSAERFGWRVRTGNNHAKLLLFDTDRGAFVVETSSNLNELPNMEFFIFEQDAELLAFYRRLFFGAESGGREICQTSDSPSSSSGPTAESTSQKPRSRSGSAARLKPSPSSGSNIRPGCRRR